MDQIEKDILIRIEKNGDATIRQLGLDTRHSWAAVDKAVRKLVLANKVEVRKFANLNIISLRSEAGP
jgi:hypothetical protein